MLASEIRASDLNEMKAQWFGRYLLLDKVASGGMAEVWRAKIVGEANFQRIVALKKILSHVSEDPEFVTMFQDEANITVALQHPNIGQVLEFSKFEEIYYIAMEYISGKDLKSVWHHLRQRKLILPLEIACYIVQKMAEGLDYAHRKRDNLGNPLGIVHRDVSPQNCLLSWEGDVKVIDFGIAAAEDKSSKTKAGTLKGKFAYMSPEQIRGLKLDGRADVFALGIVLYELLTGERCFAAESEYALLEKVRNVEIRPPRAVNPNLPTEVERIILKALARERDERYLSGGELAEDIQRLFLTKGRPPNSQMLGQFLRENFTADYDKERLRLESFREAEADTPPPTLHPTGIQPAAVPAADAGLAAVQAALAADLESMAQNQSVGGIRPAGARPIFPSSDSGSLVLDTPRPEHTPVTGHRAMPPPTSPVMRRANVAPPRTVPLMRKAEVSAPAAPAPKPRRKSGSMLAKLAVFLIVCTVPLGIYYGDRLMPPKMGSLVVNVKHVLDAKVRVDGREVGVASPSLFVNEVRQGRHTIIVEKLGYLSYTEDVFVEAEQNITIEAPLKRISGRVRVTSTPSGATIYLDGDNTGKKTPAVLDDVDTGGGHEIVIKLDGFQDGLRQGVQTKPAQEEAVRFTLERVDVEIKLDSEPSGASVYVDGTKIGKTPVSFSRNPELPPAEVVLKKSRCKTLKTALAMSAAESENTHNLALKCR